MSKMTQEQIKLVAEEYAKYRGGNQAYYNGRMINMLEWLNERFCIVEKNKVNDYYLRRLKDANMVTHDPRDAYEQSDARSQILALENIFGKELKELKS